MGLFAALNDIACLSTESCLLLLHVIKPHHTTRKKQRAVTCFVSLRVFVCVSVCLSVSLWVCVCFSVSVCVCLCLRVRYSGRHCTQFPLMSLLCNSTFAWDKRCAFALTLQEILQAYPHSKFILPHLRTQFVRLPIQFCAVAF